MANTSREAPVFQLVRANHEQAEQGHKRLREDLRDYEERLVKLEALVSEQGFKLQTISTTAPDLAKLNLSPGIVVGIVMTIIGIVAGQQASTWGMRSDIRDISTKMNARTETDLTLQKLSDQRASELKSATDAIGKKQELLQLKFEELRDQVLGQRRSPR